MFIVFLLVLFCGLVTGSTISGSKIVLKASRGNGSPLRLCEVRLQSWLGTEIKLSEFVSEDHALAADGDTNTCTNIEGDVLEWSAAFEYNPEEYLEKLIVDFPQDGGSMELSVIVGEMEVAKLWGLGSREEINLPTKQYIEFMHLGEVESFHVCGIRLYSRLGRLIPHTESEYCGTRSFHRTEFYGYTNDPIEYMEFTSSEDPRELLVELNRLQFRIEQPTYSRSNEALHHIRFENTLSYIGLDESLDLCYFGADNVGGKIHLTNPTQSSIPYNLEMSILQSSAENALLEELEQCCKANSADRIPVWSSRFVVSQNSPVREITTKQKTSKNTFVLFQNQDVIGFGTGSAGFSLPDKHDTGERFVIKSTENFLLCSVAILNQNNEKQLFVQQSHSLELCVTTTTFEGIIKKPIREEEEVHQFTVRFLSTGLLNSNADLFFYLNERLIDVKTRSSILTSENLEISFFVPMNRPYVLQLINFRQPLNLCGIETEGVSYSRVTGSYGTADANMAISREGCAVSQGESKVKWWWWQAQYENPEGTLASEIYIQNPTKDTLVFLNGKLVYKVENTISGTLTIYPQLWNAFTITAPESNRVDIVITKSIKQMEPFKVKPLSHIRVSGGATLNAQNTSRHFIIEPYGSLVVDNLSLEYGRATLEANSADRFGGSIAVKKNGIIPLIRNCYFYRNLAFGGGALAMDQNSRLHYLEHSSFVDNRAISSDSNEGGGAIFLVELKQPVTIILATKFKTNVASGNGGAVFARKSRIERFKQTHFDMNNAKLVAQAIHFAGAGFQPPCQVVGINSLNNIEANAFYDSIDSCDKLSFPTLCPDGWTQVRAICLNMFVSDIAIDYETAKTSCKSHGETADLVQVFDGLLSHSAYTKLIERKEILGGFLPGDTKAGVTTALIGMTKFENEWRNGLLPVVYTNWAIGFPTTTGECVKIRSSTGNWITSDCKSNSYICQLQSTCESGKQYPVTVNNYQFDLCETEPIPSEWFCPKGNYAANDGCDCGCGALDPDCLGSGQVLRCHDLPFGTSTNAYTCDVEETFSCTKGDIPEKWMCSEDKYSDGSTCDCNCGANDPDCDSTNNNHPIQCYDEFHNPYQVSNGFKCVDDLCVDALPASWTCGRNSYDSKDGCDCECGALDPDCTGGNYDKLHCMDSSYILVDGASEARCNLTTLSCEQITRNCETEFFRKSNCGDGIPCETCGDCLRNYFSDTTDGVCIYEKTMSPKFIYDSNYLESTMELTDEVLGKMVFYENGISVCVYNSTTLLTYFSDESVIIFTSFDGIVGDLHGNIIFADLDGDGSKEGFVGTTNGTIVTFQNSLNMDWIVFENEWFDEVLYFVPEEEKLRLALADVDADSDMELLLYNDDGYFMYFRNDGSRTNPEFTPLYENNSPFSSLLGDIQQYGLCNVAFTDLDSDGLLDCVLKSNSADELMVLRNVAGAFEMKQEERVDFDFINVTETCNFQFILFDEDLSDDLIANGIEVYRNFHGAKLPFFSKRSQPIPKVTLDQIEKSIQVESLCFHDYNDDGKKDLFVGDAFGKVHYFENLGLKTNKPVFKQRFGNENPARFISASETITKLSVRSGTYSNTILVREGESKLFEAYTLVLPNTTIDTGSATTVFNTNSLFADFDDDGYDEIVFANPLTMMIEYRDENGTLLLPNPFEGITLQNNEGINGNAEHRFLAADVDGDGDLDLIYRFTTNIKNLLYWYENVGNRENPKFMDDRKVQFFLSMDSIILGFMDLDGDGDEDIISLQANNRKLDFFQNSAFECAGTCLDRGFCAGSSSDLTSNFVFQVVSDFQSLEIDDAYGKCYCVPQFEGTKCQRCAPSYFGINCENSCPEYSKNTRSDRDYPIETGLNDCECDPTFTRIDIIEENNFECVCPAGYGFNSVNSVCEQCPLGYFKSRNSLDQCTSCETLLSRSTTMFSGAIDGSVDCVCKNSFVLSNETCLCPPGTGYENSTDSCVACGIGYFSSSNSLAQCDQCPSGSTTLNVGTSDGFDCIPETCPEGLEKNKQGRCEPCELNHFRNENMTACEACDKGYFASSGSSACTICPINSFRAIGQSNCVLCDEGFYSNGTSPCQICPANTFRSITDLECKPCPKGSYSFPGSDTCTPCGINQYRNNTERCMDCDPGYVSEVGSSFCLPCPENTFRSKDKTDCNTCDSGFVSSIGSENCTACVPGTFRTVDDNVCKPCPQGYFSFQHGSNICLKCPVEFPETFGNGSKSEADCVTAPGSFVQLSFSTKNLEAVSCDAILSGVSCDRPGITLETLDVLPGYWRISKTSTDIRKCAKASYCDPNYESRILSNDGEEVDWDPSSYCTPFHTGVMCSACVENYSMGSGECEYCDEDEISEAKGWFAFWIFVGIVLLFLPSMLIVYVGRKNTNVDTENASTDRDENRCLRKVSFFNKFDTRSLGIIKQMFAVKFRILIGFFQVAAVYTESVALLGSDSSSSKATQFLVSLINIDFSGVLNSWELGCAWQSNFYSYLPLYTLSPIICFALMIFTLKLFQKLKLFDTNGYEHAKAQTIWSILQICFFIYPGVSKMIFSTFLFERFERYENDPEPIHTLRTDHTVDFDTTSSKFWRAYSAIMIIVYPVGIVALFFACARLYFFRKLAKMREEDNNDYENGGDRKVTKPFVLAISFLCVSYRPSYYWFECFELFRKLMLTSVYTIIHQFVEDQASVIFLLLVIVFLVTVQKSTPFKHSHDQLFAEISLFFLILLPFVHLISIPSQNVVRNLVIVVFAIELILFFYVIYLEIRDFTLGKGRSETAYTTSSFGDEEQQQEKQQEEKQQEDEKTENKNYVVTDEEIQIT